MPRMSVPLSAPGRLAATAALCLAGLLLAAPAMSQGDKEKKKRRATASAPPPVSAEALRDGQAEARLMAVYKLVAEGRGREALVQAESLARDYPNFQLAQLVVGDLLNARLRHVVWGAAEPKTGAAGSVLNVFSLPQLNHQTRIEGGVLSDECAQPLQTFFKNQRAQQKARALATRLRDDAVRTPEHAFDGLPDYPWQASGTACNSRPGDRGISATAGLPRRVRALRCWPTARPRAQPVRSLRPVQRHGAGGS